VLPYTGNQNELKEKVEYETPSNEQHSPTEAKTTRKRKHDEPLETKKTKNVNVTKTTTTNIFMKKVPSKRKKRRDERIKKPLL